MEHAGLTRNTLAGSRTGVFVGLTHDDYQFVHAEAGALEGPYGYMGNSFSMASGRIAYTMGLHGPAMTVDTACSSGLVAVHLACRSLHDGESDIALAGGVIGDAGTAQVLFGFGAGHAVADRALPCVRRRRRRVRAGEGCAVLLLKRLPDALARRRPDPGRAARHGRQPGRPHGEHRDAVADAQVEVYRAALAAAGVDARTVGMVEAHGTGTPVGDPHRIRQPGRGVRHSTGRARSHR